MSVSEVKEKESDMEICPSLPIPELIKLVKSSCRESELNEVERKLIDHKNSVGGFVKELRERIHFLERAVVSNAADKEKFEEKWREAREECRVLKERIDRLSDGEEWCMKACGENSEVGKSRKRFVLSKENGESKWKFDESVPTVGDYEEKYRGLKMKYVEMYNEMEGLRKEKEVADRAVEELKRRELDGNRIVEELRRQNSEALQRIEELWLKKAESDKAAELSKRRIENLAPRISKVEASLASFLNVNVEDLVNIVKVGESPGVVEEANHVRIPDSEDKRESFGNGSALNGEYADNGNVTATSPGVHSTCNSTGIGNSGLLKTGDLNEGVENAVVSSQTKGDGADEFHTSPGVSPGAQSGWHPPEAETKDTDQEHESKGVLGPGAHDSDLDEKVPITELVMSKAGCSGKMQFSSPAPLVVIEISDSDDECISGGEACNTGNRSDGSVKEMIHAEPVRAPFGQTNKRNTTDWADCSPRSSNAKRKRIENGSESDKSQNGEEGKNVLEPTRDRLGSLDNDRPLKPVLDLSSQPHHAPLSMTESDFRTPLQKLDDLIDEFSSDSDESCSDSHMNDLIADYQSQKHGRKWICRADMVKAFEEDDELCMNAVCALHRQQFYAEKSSRASNMCKGEGFSLIDAISGSALAEYLIDGDSELRLRKSVSEVQQQRPDAISQCKKLARNYQERLFDIYQNSEDPFFGKLNG